MVTVVANNGDWKGFANIRLERADKKAVKKAAEDFGDDKLMQWIFEMSDDGYKISVSPDLENSAVVASLTGVVPDSENAGLTMTQRHSDVRVALLALRYAHESIAKRGPWEEAENDWRDADW